MSIQTSCAQYDLNPDDIVTALTAGNVILPAGNLYSKDQMPLVPNHRDDFRHSGLRRHPGQAGPERLSA